MLIAILVAWLSCGALAGYMFIYDMRMSFPSLYTPDNRLHMRERFGEEFVRGLKRTDRVFAAFFALFGPIGLVTALIAAEHYPWSAK